MMMDEADRIALEFLDRVEGSPAVSQREPQQTRGGAEMCGGIQFVSTRIGAGHGAGGGMIVPEDVCPDAFAALAGQFNRFRMPGMEGDLGQIDECERRIGRARVFGN